MKLEARDYQRRGAEFIIDTPRCNVWADMGLGKCVMVLTAIDLLGICGSRIEPALVLGPLRVARDVWEPETVKWDQFNHLRVSTIVGSARERTDALKAKADIYTCNYENLPWLVDKVGNDWPFKNVIADESTRLKGYRLRKGGKRATALAKVASLTGRWVNLTGTPAPNGLKDLWGQNWFVDHGQRLGRTYGSFQERWFKVNPYSRAMTPHAFAEDEIVDLMADVTLSLEASDYFDLPPIIINQIEIELPPKARALYDQMEEELGIFVDGHEEEIEALGAASKSIKCSQIANGAIYTNKKCTEWALMHDAKMDALKSIISEQAGAPLIIVYQWKSDLERIKKAVPNCREMKTKKDYKDWNAGKIPALVLHAKSAGHGLNMQDGGNAIVFFGHWWDLEEYMQVIERIGPVRQMQSGHNRPVILHNIIARNTVDEDMIARRDSKMSVQNALRAGIARRQRR